MTVNSYLRSESLKSRGATAVAVLLCLVMGLAMLTGSSDEFRPLNRETSASASSECSGPLAIFTPRSVFGLVVVGLASGIFGGMLGMGGGVLKMSILLGCFSFHPGLSRFSALLSYFVVALGATYRYRKLGYVMTDAVRMLVPAGLIGIVVGVLLGGLLPRLVLTLTLGVFLLFIFVAMVKKVIGALPGDRASPSGTEGVSVLQGWRLMLCALPGGLSSGLLGISGGVVVNPLQQVLARIPVKNAIANSLCLACFTVPLACVIILMMGVSSGHFDFWTPVLVALCLIPGSVVGSQLGPVLTRRMSPTSAHALVGVVALFMGIFMLFFVS